MIPKKIHYCWFGSGELPDKDKKNIENWKKLCPDYEIIRWDESNYDYKKNKYMKQAYKSKKWGFVPDYARLDIIYRYGGFYFDTDVELLKPLDEFLNYTGVMGFEDGYHVNGGHGFGAEPGNKLIKDLRDFYNDRSFIADNGEPDLTPSPIYITQVLLSKGLVQNNMEQIVDGVTVFPKEYFCPKDVDTFNVEITEKTISIHHFNSTWHTPKMQKQKKRTILIRRIFGRCLGDKIIRLIVWFGGIRKKYGVTTK